MMRKSTFLNFIEHLFPIETKSSTSTMISKGSRKHHFSDVIKPHLVGHVLILGNASFICILVTVQPRCWHLLAIKVYKKGKCLFFFLSLVHRNFAFSLLMSKTASVRFYRCSNKREYRSDRELVNLINFRWWLEREISWKGLILMEENNNKKSLGIYWSILITSHSQTNPKPLILYWSHFLKTTFS